MNNQILKKSLLGLTCGIACGFLSAQAQTYTPNAWVNDPFTPNPGFTITGANTSSPSYVNSTGTLYNQNLYGYSPIGSTITLTTPGTSVIFSSTVTASGNVANANLQFRYGILYKGSSPNDVNWGGVLTPLPNASGQPGLYEEKLTPTGAVFSTGGSATTVYGGTYVNGSQAGAFNYMVSVTYLTPTTSLERWMIQGLNGNAYAFYGRYTNTTTTAMCGYNFDTVGFLKGGSVFGGNSTANTLAFGNVQVVVGNFSDGTWTNTGVGTWSTTANWLNAVPANGAGFIADFSQLALTADATVTLDSARTIGGLIFGATGGSLNNWILNNSGGSALTLDPAFPTVPSIAVNQNTATLDLPLVCTNGLTETGPGTLVLGANNTIAGTLYLNGGELNFSSLANLPLSSTAISTVSFGGGGLQWAPGNTLDISAQGAAFAFATNAAIFDTGANNVTLANNFGDYGVGGLTKLGTGKLTVGNNAFYSGTTTVSNGVLALGTSSAISSSTNLLVLSGATLDVSALGSSGLPLSQSFSGMGTVLGNLSASGQAIGAGYTATGAAGTLTVNGNLSLGGGSLNYGLANDTTVGAGVNDLIAVSGNLNISSPMTINVSLINSAPGLGTYILFTYGSLTAGSAANLTPPAGFSVVNDTVGKTIGLNVSHVPVNLTWQGDGSLNYWDTSTTANWTNSAGTAVDFLPSDFVTFDNTGNDAQPINIESGNVLPGSVTVNASQNYDFTGAAIANGSLTKNGAGTLILENNNTYKGATVIGGGVLQVGGPNASGLSGTLGTGPITNNGALVFDLAQDYTVTTNIYGTGSISNIGSSGTVTLSGNIVKGGSMNMAGVSAAMVLSGTNSYTGQTLVSAGSLHPRNGLSLSTNSVAVASGAQLYIDANVNITNKLSLAGTGITGDGALRKGGNGVTTLFGVITLTNNTLFEVDGGSTLYLTNAAGINAPGINVILDAASGGAGTITGPLTLGSGSLTSQDAGTWIIAPTNTYTGLTVINGGLLEISGANAGTAALGPLSAINPAYVTLGGGRLGVSNNVSFADGLRGFTVSGTAGGFDVGPGATLLIANPITGSGTLTKSSPGTLVLSGANPFNGTLYVDSANNVNNDGVVIVTSSSAIANVLSPIALRNTLGGASTFEVIGTNGNVVVTQDFTMNGRSPNIPAILSAAGTNTLSGNFSFGGNGQFYLECDSGLLTLGTASTALTSTSVDPETLTLRGNGAISVLGSISDSTNAAALVSVAKAGNGTLTLGALNTYSGSTAVTAGALIVNGAIGSGTNAGTVTVSGGTLSGTGIINAQVNVGAAGTLSPGAPLGTLTINSNLTLAGNTLVSVSAPGTSSQVAGLTSVNYGGTLTVTNLGGALAAGNNFQIFPATTFTGDFTSIVGPPGVTFTFTPSTGVLSVASVVSRVPVNMAFSVSGGKLNFSWPTDHLGWNLQSNSIDVGVSTDWFNIPGTSAVTSTNITIPTTGDVYFRMQLP
jgi:autotransporter-associated beta strand protein